MKTIKELNSMAVIDDYSEGQKKALKEVLEVIDERIKMLKEIMANSKHVNKTKELMNIFKASVKELEELKARINGK